jgi:hypothetical protein
LLERALFSKNFAHSFHGGELFFVPPSASFAYFIDLIAEFGSSSMRKTSL